MESDSAQTRVTFLEWRQPTWFTVDFKLWLNVRGMAILILTLLAMEAILTPPPRPSSLSLLVILEHTLKLIGPGFLLLLTLWGWFNRNLYIARTLNPGPGTAIAEVQFQPRRYTGLERHLEDADGIGLIRLEEDGLRFESDSVALFLRREDIAEVQTVHGGNLVSWFLVRTRLELARPVEGIQTLAFTSRSGLVLSQYVQQNRELDRRIQYWFVGTGGRGQGNVS